MSRTARTGRIPMIVGLLAGALLLVGGLRADDADEKPGKDKKAVEKPTTIVLDVSKLPPEVVKKLLELAETKKRPPEEKKGPPKVPPGLADKGKLPPGDPLKGEGAKPGAKAGRPIGLTEAIAIAEKAGKGEAVKAERRGEGDGTHFNIELVGKGGERHKVTVDASGKVNEAEGGPPAKKAPPKKDD